MFPKLEKYWTGSLSGLAKFTILVAVLLGLTVGLTLSAFMVEGFQLDEKLLFLILVGLNFSIYVRLILRRIAKPKAPHEREKAPHP